MQSGGEGLEKVAEGRAANALKALEEAAPTTLHKVIRGEIEEVAADRVQQGDTILVRPGEMLGCDGEVIDGESHVDTSSITGEPIPLRISVGSRIMSGSINQESPFMLRVSAVARESQYARIVALVREAKESKAPLQRIADRYAVMFTPLTVGVCAVAYLVSRDWNRVLAVLAVATPCPLILATPVAVLGGLSNAARKKILMRTGGALESLGNATAVLFDKTGTITIGHPRVARIRAVQPATEDEIVRLASAVEQGSGHPLGQTLIAEAKARGLMTAAATGVQESPGRGVEGDVDGKHVIVGARSLIVSRNPGARLEIENLEGNDSAPQLRAYVAVNGKLAGLIDYADQIRPGIRELVQHLKSAGVEHVLLLSGDRAENARHVAALAGIEDWRGDMLPEDKVEVVKRFLHDGERVIVVGDGTNDAPALSTATVGVALASRGRGVATEAADVILLADDPSRLGDAIDISKRTMRIARQSIWAGLGISAIGMLLAGAGRIAPIAGAALQELVDLAVILNALRAAVREKPIRNPPEPDRILVPSPVR
jgi:heavy metal translocating P-type ATPase